MRVIWHVLIILIIYFKPPLVFANEVNIVTGDDYFPFTDYSYPGGGIANQIIIKSLLKSGIEAKITRKPWARGLQDTLHGTYIATFPYLKSKDREVLFTYSSPLYAISQFFYYKKGRVLDFSKRQIFCNPAGWTVMDPINKMLRADLISMETTSGLDICAKMILADRVDFFVANQFIVQNMRLPSFIKKQLDKKLIKNAQVYEYLIVSKSNKDGVKFLMQFEDGLRKIKDDGEYYCIIQALQEVASKNCTQ